MTDSPGPGTPPQRGPALPPARAAAAAPAYYAPPKKLTVWPKVIGIISIVLGSLGCLCGACNTIGAVFGTVMLRAMGGLAEAAAPMSAAGPAATGPKTNAEAEQAAAFMDAMGWLYTSQAIAALISLGGAIVLLIAGIKVLGRRRSGRTLHFVYGACQLVSVTVSVVVTMHFASAMADMMAATSGGDPQMDEMMQGFMGAWVKLMMGVSSVWTVVWGLSYPVFLLIWFLLPKIRREVSGWNGAQAAGLQRV